MLWLASTSTTRATLASSSGTTAARVLHSGLARAQANSSTAATRRARMMKSRSRLWARRCSAISRTKRSVERGIFLGRGRVSQWTASGIAAHSAPT